MDETIKQTDAALLPFLNSAGESEADFALADLLDRQIQPVIERTLRAKFYTSLKPGDFSQLNQDVLELSSEVKLLVIARLRKLKSSHHEKTIQNLDGYVTGVTINAYRQYLRAKYPLRQQLKNKLRYLLTHHPKFVLWEEQGDWFCGLRFNKRFAVKAPLPPQRDAETIRAGIAETVNNQNLSEAGRTIDLLAAIFEFAKVPILFIDLLSLVAEIQGVKDQKEVSSDEAALQEKFAATDGRMLTAIEERENLKKVWTEICALPLRHRLALLLNLKDKQGDCLIRLLPVLRVASVRQIAAVLEFEADEFARVWRELPWDDLKIADYMNLTRQQVINLRQSARARLIRLFAKKD